MYTNSFSSWLHQVSDGEQIYYSRTVLSRAKEAQVPKIAAHMEHHTDYAKNPIKIVVETMTIN